MSISPALERVPISKRLLLLASPPRLTLRFYLRKWSRIGLPGCEPLDSCSEPLKLAVNLSQLKRRVFGCLGNPNIRWWRTLRRVAGIVIRSIFRPPLLT
jgi:hypothetical protein